MIKAVRLGTIAFFSFSLGCQQRVDAGAEPGEIAPELGGKPGASFGREKQDSVVHVPTPDTLRGLYVNRWAALGSKLTRLIGVAKTTEVNALVIDVKDDRGFVLYRSSVALAREIGADTADGHWMSRAKIRAVLDTMTANGIYPIARIVVAKDPLLARKRLDLAIKRKSDLKPWLDKNGNPWLDPHQPAVWQYAADLAREAYDIGFSEIQFDYVRFPDEKRLITETVYPLAKGRTRAQVIREQLGFLRNALKPQGVRVTADGSITRSRTRSPVLHRSPTPPRSSPGIRISHLVGRDIPRPRSGHRKKPVTTTGSRAGYSGTRRATTRSRLSSRGHSEAL